MKSNSTAQTGILTASELYDALFELSATNADASNSSHDSNTSNSNTSNPEAAIEATLKKDSWGNNKELILKIDCRAYPETCRKIAAKCGME